MHTEVRPFKLIRMLFQEHSMIPSRLHIPVV